MKLTIERAKELLSYEPETGHLRWRGWPGNDRFERALNTKFKGKIAGTLDDKGYIRVRIDDVFYIAHRVAWFIHFGSFTKQTIDHVNGIKSDNRIVNLREASSAENARNVRLSKANTSGFRGVVKCSRTEKWIAQISTKLEGVSKCERLGRFNSKEEAAAAYVTAARERFGEFAGV